MLIWNIMLSKTPKKSIRLAAKDMPRSVAPTTKRKAGASARLADKYSGMKTSRVVVDSITGKERMVWVEIKSPKLSDFRNLMIADEPSRVAWVHRGMSITIMDQAAQALAVSKNTLFDALGLPVSTMTRRAKSGSPLSLDEADRMDRVAQAFKRAIDVFGSEDAAQEWLSTRVPALGDRTPLELLDTSAGYQMVLNTIGRIAYGAPA